MTLEFGNFSHHLHQVKAWGGITSDANDLPISATTGSITLDCTGDLELNSSGGAISIGSDAVAFPVNIGSSASARVITIGNPASGSLSMDGGIGTASLLCDGIMTIDSSAGAINIGPSAVAQTINIGTAGARPINVGSSAAGAMSLQSASTLALSSAGNISMNSSSGTIQIGSTGAQPITIGSVGARSIAIGNASAAGITLDGGAGSSTYSTGGPLFSIAASGGSLTLDSITSLELNSVSGAILIGNDSRTGAVSIASAGARPVSIGGPSATSLTLSCGGSTILSTTGSWFNRSGGSFVNLQAATNFGAMVGNVTPTAAQVLVRVMYGDPNGAARTVTLPTAAQMVAAIPGILVSDCFEFSLINQSTTLGQKLTIAVGAGGTDIGNMDVEPHDAVGLHNGSGKFLMYFTNVNGGTEAYTLYRSS